MKHIYFIFILGGLFAQSLRIHTMHTEFRATEYEDAFKHSDTGTDADFYKNGSKLGAINNATGKINYITSMINPEDFVSELSKNLTAMKNVPLSSAEKTALVAALTNAHNDGNYDDFNNNLAAILHDRNANFDEEQLYTILKKSEELINSWQSTFNQINFLFSKGLTNIGLSSLKASIKNPSESAQNHKIVVLSETQKSKVEEKIAAKAKAAAEKKVEQGAQAKIQREQSDRYQTNNNTIQKAMKKRSFSKEIAQAYTDLDLDPTTATMAAVKKAYKTLSLKYHPDRYNGSEPAYAQMKLLETQSAYEKITDNNAPDPVASSEQPQTAPSNPTPAPSSDSTFEDFQRTNTDNLSLSTKFQNEFGRIGNSQKRIDAMAQRFGVRATQLEQTSKRITEIINKPFDMLGKEDTSFIADILEKLNSTKDIRNPDNYAYIKTELTTITESINQNLEINKTFQFFEMANQSKPAQKAATNTRGWQN